MSKTESRQFIYHPIVAGDVGTNTEFPATNLQRQTAINVALEAQDATPTSQTIEIFTANAACEVTKVQFKLNDTGTATTDIDYDLYKLAAGATGQGATILSAVVNITNSETDNTFYPATINNGTLAAGDSLLIVVDVSGGTTGSHGGFAQVFITESFVS